MNHLAHLLLSPPDPDWQIGSLLGDFVRGENWRQWPAPIQHGIALHRAVDAFTDAHPQFTASRQRIGGSLRRYSGVLVDVFYDHFLLRRWAQLGSGTSAEQFAAAIYALLHARCGSMPEGLRASLPRMIENRWLEKTSDLRGVRTVLDRISLRMRRSVEFSSGADFLATHYDEFANDFDAFWPEVARFAKAHAGALHLSNTLAGAN
jgi:acyl carrier protein phosphodiesterase